MAGPLPGLALEHQRRMRLFLKDADFEAFERNIVKTLDSRPMRICAYCLLSNPWHLVLWP